MKAIILAAGRGSRMKKLTDELPKCLVEIRGKTLLDWQLEALRAAGITEIAIVTGYKREMLTNRGMFDFHNPRWAETNMVSSLECAQEWLKEEPCIVSYSDIFYDSSAVTSLMVSDALLAVTYDPKWLELWSKRFGDPLLDAETFRPTLENTLAEIGKKPSSVDEVQGQYMGLLKITPKAWREIMRLRDKLTQKEKDSIHMTDTLQAIINSGKILIDAIPYDKKWGEIDNQKDLILYKNLAKYNEF